MHYAAQGDEDNQWDKKWMATVDDREQDDTNPPFVRLKQSYCDWRDVKLPTDVSDASPIVT